MEKLTNKKILAVILIVAGIIIIAVTFFLSKDTSVEPKPKPDDSTETPIVPDDGDIVIPDDSDPDYVSPDPSEPTEPDDSDDITPPEDDQTPEDTSGFPKPGDGDGDEGDEEPDPPKETSYKENFDDPIDPNTESEEHKEVYERVQDFVHFTVKYPTWIPEGFVMTEVNADEGGILESGKYYGINIMTYIEGDKKVEIMEGMVDLGTTEEIEEVEIKEGVTGKLWKWQEYGTPSEDNTVLGLSVYFGVSGGDYKYYILGENVNKTELIDIAKSLESL